ncbi:MAG: hypothetical protein MZV70_21025 [Desulfobacterales bacterium]|nr:hypothetical protein [Desulfobacterales bacterium]
MEVFAGFVGARRLATSARLIDAIEELGELDNTLDLLHLGRQRRQRRRARSPASFNETDLAAERHPATRRAAAAALIDKLGGLEALGGPRPTARTHAGWAWARQTRRSSGASRSARTSAARATRWSSPGRAASRRGERRARSSHHVIDIAPTILRRGRHHRSRRSVDGIEQDPMDGVSFAYTLRRRQGAEARHTSQYFEINGSRAHLPGRLVRRHLRPADARGCTGAPRTGRAGTRPRTCGSSTTSPGTSRRPTTSPPRSRSGSRR